MFLSTNRNYFFYPFLISFGGHVLGFFLAFYAFNKEPNTNLAKVSYTVSLEKGKSKSSKNVSKVKKKAPVKKASLKKEKKVVKKVKSVPKKIVQKKVEKKEIVSLKKKEKKKKEVPKKLVKKEKREKKTDVNKEYQDAMKEYLSIAKKNETTALSTDKSNDAGNGGSGILKSPEFFEYFSLLERRIRNVWNWHDSRVSYVATVSFRINSNGTVHSIRVIEGSGNRLYDQSVVRAVKKASPVPIPPRKVYADFKHIIMDFTPE